MSRMKGQGQELIRKLHHRSSGHNNAKGIVIVFQLMVSFSSKNVGFHVVLSDS